MQAEVALALERHGDADAAFRQGEQFANAMSEGFPVPEIHRLRGELAIRRRTEREAEECFRTSIEVERKQGSNAYQLRAIFSLSRRLQSGGRSEEAVQSLDAALNQFKEGQDARDLIDAA